MKMRKSAGILRFFQSSLLVVLLPLLSAAQNGDGGFVVDKIIAKVDNYIVLKSDLEATYQAYLASGNENTPTLKCDLLAQLITDKLMVAKAEIDSVIVTDDDVDQNTSQRIDMIIRQYGGSQQAIEQMYGKTLDQIRVELRDQVREQLLIREMQQRITKDIKITPAEIRKFFNRIPADSLPYFSADVEVGQLVRVAKVSQEQKNKTVAELIELRDRALAGEDFGELAKKHSTEPSAQYTGGDLGWAGRGMMVPQFEATAFKTKIGDISMPFETDFGFHILKLLDRRGNEYHAQHILLSTTPSQSDMRRTWAELDSIRRLIVYDSTTFIKAVKEFSDDLGTKMNGGYFLDKEGGTRILVEELDPVVFFTIDTMKVGSVSPPIEYRTEQGKTGYRIVYLKSKSKPHQANLNDDWHRIQAAALAEKKNRILSKWFEKARKDVFINIDPLYDNCNLLN
jgi:peptidyl-prolyl cis-trans isomerase SurA